MRITRRSFFKVSAGISIVAISNKLFGVLPTTPQSFDLTTFANSLKEVSAPMQNVIDALTKVTQYLAK